MEWIDIASIIFVCVTMNHLGLVGKAEEMVGELPILNCAKCSSFWCCLAYGLWRADFSDLPLTLAVSFLASYVAIWVELFEGYIDTLFDRTYEKIYSTTEQNNPSATKDCKADTNGKLSDLRKDDK